MAEETVQETEDVSPAQAQPSAGNDADTQESGRPNAYTFAGFLLGGWVALMVAFVLIAAVGMTLVGVVAG